MSAEELRKLLLGAKLELLDDNILEYFHFGDQGHIIATIGSKDGAVCAPILYYVVTDDCRVGLKLAGTIRWIWDSFELRDGVLETRCYDVAMCNYAQKCFKFTPGVKEQPPYLP